MADHRVITFAGINVPGISTPVPWKNFVTMNPQQQGQIMTKAGMTADEQSQLLGLLKKNQNITWAQNYGSDYPIIGPFIGNEGKGWVDPGYSKLSDQLMNEADARAQTTQNQQYLTQAGGGTPKKPAQPQVFPAYSPQALKAYTDNFLMPMQKEMNSLIQGDMTQWEGAVQSIAQATGQQNSPVTQLMQANAKTMAPLMQLLGNVTNESQFSQPYVDMVNNAIGANTTEGARLQALGTMAQYLLQYGLIDPTTASMLTQSGSALGTGGINSLTGGLTGTNPLTQILGSSPLTNAPAPTGTTPTTVAGG